MVEALVIAVIYCVVVMAVAWLLTVLVSFIPMPPQIKSVVTTFIWIIAVVICLFILLRLLTGAMP